MLSSQIEGTQSSLSDLLLFELDEVPGVPLDDVLEVSNYVAALVHGLRRIRGGFPISNRLIREIHRVLRRNTYYNLLDGVRREGEWERWLAFFVEGVRQTADSAVATAERLGTLFRDDRERLVGIGAQGGIGAADPRRARGAPTRVRAGRRGAQRLVLSRRGVVVGCARAARHRERAHRAAPQPDLRVRPLPVDPQRGDREPPGLRNSATTALASSTAG